MPSKWQIGDDFLRQALGVLNGQNDTLEGLTLDRSTAQVLVLIELVKELRVMNDNLKALEGTLDLVRGQISEK